MDNVFIWEQLGYETREDWIAAGKPSLKVPSKSVSLVGEPIRLEDTEQILAAKEDAAIAKITALEKKMEAEEIVRGKGAIYREKQRAFSKAQVAFDDWKRSCYSRNKHRETAPYYQPSPGALYSMALEAARTTLTNHRFTEESSNMNATYSVDFHSANARHERATDSFLAEMSILYPEHVYKRLEGLNDQGCDLVLTVDGYDWNVEIKTLAGASSKGTAYPTFCVEMFADFAQTHRTDWRDHSNYIVFINMATRTAHLYDSSKLDAYCSGKTLRPSGTGTGQYGVKNKLCSWVVCVPWVCKEAGHVLSVKLGA